MSADLFATPTPTAPEKPKRPELPDFWSMLARKLLGITDERWRWYTLSVVDHDQPRAVAQSMIEGAIPTGEVFKSGKRKGELNLCKKVPGSERKVCVFFRDYDAFVKEWERENATCSTCMNTGLASAGWSVAEGQKYRPCQCGRMESSR